MKLTYREAQRLMVGLRRVEEHDDTKLSGETRLKIGININRLMPNVRVFEKEVNRIQVQLTNGGAVDQMRSMTLSYDMEAISEKIEDYKLKKFKIEDFELKSNPRIKAETISMVAPLISNFDDGTSDED